MLVGSHWFSVSSTMKKKKYNTVSRQLAVYAIVSSPLFIIFFIKRKKAKKKITTKPTLSTVEFWRDLSHSSPFVKNFFQVWPNRRVTSVWTWHTNPPFPPRAKERVTTDIVDCDVIVYLMQFNVLMGIEIYMHDIRCWLKLFFLFREERSWE